MNEIQTLANEFYTGEEAFQTRSEVLKAFKIFRNLKTFQLPEWIKSSLETMWKTLQNINKLSKTLEKSQKAFLQQMKSC